MKILFAGLKYDYGIPTRGESLESKTFVPALKALASEFETFWFEENGFPSNTETLQKSLIAYADKIRPDLIFFVLMKDEITTDTLSYLRQSYVTTNWFCDDTWRFNQFTKNIAPFLKLPITNDKFSISEYKKIGCEHVMLSQWATVDYDANLDLNNVDYKYDISFVGSKNPTREWVISELRKQNLNVHCFGAGWDLGRVSFNEMKEIFYTSKVNLNLSNSVPRSLSFLKFVLIKFLRSVFDFSEGFNAYLKRIKTNLQYIKFYFTGTKTAEQVKARNFEISGWGGFQLSQYALELEDYYTIGREIAIFTNIQELVTQCKFYLNNELFRKEICSNGHKRTGDHTYQNRMHGVILEVQKTIEKNAKY